MVEALLDIQHLTTVFPTRRGIVKAVNDVSLKISLGEIWGIVGESGCGKSTVLRSIMRLISQPGRIVKGEIFFRGKDLLRLSVNDIRDVRGKEISMIFQDPLSTLNPVFPVGEQIREAVRLHGILNDTTLPIPWFSKRQQRTNEKKRVIEVMQEVGISAPEARYRAYPHEYSGGMQQRALIAIGIVCNPALILADEPTTALDVTIQAQIIDLLGQINREHNSSIMLVTHNLALASEFCHNIAVMYAGRIVESGPVDKIMETPKHPYTQGLLNCLPRISKQKQPDERIQPIPGNVPDLADLPEGCAFKARCSHAEARCENPGLALRQVAADHAVRCTLYDDIYLHRHD